MTRHLLALLLLTSGCGESMATGVRECVDVERRPSCIIPLDMLADDPRLATACIEMVKCIHKEEGSDGVARCVQPSEAVEIRAVEHYERPVYGVDAPETHMNYAKIQVREGADGWVPVAVTSRLTHINDVPIRPYLIEQLDAQHARLWSELDAGTRAREDEELAVLLSQARAYLQQVAPEPEESDESAATP